MGELLQISKILYLHATFLYLSINSVEQKWRSQWEVAQAVTYHLCIYSNLPIFSFIGLILI